MLRHSAPIVLLTNRNSEEYLFSAALVSQPQKTATDRKGSACRCGERSRHQHQHDHDSTNISRPSISFEFAFHRGWLKAESREEWIEERLEWRKEESPKRQR